MGDLRDSLRNAFVQLLRTDIESAMTFLEIATTSSTPEPLRDRLIVIAELNPEFKT